MSSRSCRSRVLLVASLWVALVDAGATDAFAQTSISPLDERLPQERPAGWSFTPALDYAFVWDSNILFENVGSDNIVEEEAHLLRPRADLSFVGRRGDLDVGYRGSLVQHVDFGVLDSYDQRLLARTSRQLSRRSSWFARYGAETSPTTELIEIVGVPFVRIGTRRQDIRTGLQLQLQRNTNASVSYRFHWVDFAQDVTLIERLQGGYSHGGSVTLRHAWTRRLTLTGDYDVQLASVIDGQQFMLQNSSGGVEYAVSDNISAVGSAGASYLSGVDGAPARMGPSVRVGLTANTRPAMVSVIYSRSYVPSYGFGGTSDNQELTTRVQLPLTRRIYAATAISIRTNEPLAAEDLALRSMWFYGSVGFRLADWLQLEAFTSGTRQNVDRPDGRINRYRLGLQLSTATTTRIR